MRIALRAKGAYAAPSRVGRTGSGQRAGKDHQRIGGAEGLNWFCVLLPADPGGDPAGPQVLRYVRFCLLDRYAHVAEVNAQDTIRPGVQRSKALHLCHHWFHRIPPHSSLEPEPIRSRPLRYSPGAGPHLQIGHAISASQTICPINALVGRLRRVEAPLAPRNQVRACRASCATGDGQ